MADTFTIRIAGNTAEFENNLTNVNKALKLLQSNAKTVNRDLKLDPENADLVREKYDNVQQQLELVGKKAKTAQDNLSKIKFEDDPQAWTRYNNQLSLANTNANKLRSTMESLNNDHLDLNLDGQQVTGSINKIKSSVGNLKSSFQDAFSGGLSTAGPAALSAGAKIGKGLLSGTLSAGNLIKNGLVSTISGAAGSMGTTLTSGLKTGLSAAGNLAAGAGKLIVSGLSNSVRSAGDFIKNTLTSAFNTVTSAVSTIGSALSSRLSSAAASGANALRTGLTAPVKAVGTTIVSTITSAAKTAASSFTDSMKGAVSKVTDTIKSGVSQVTIGAARQVGANAWNGLVGSFGEIKKGMQDTQTSANGLQKAMQVNGLSGQYNDLADALNKTAVATNISRSDANQFGSVLVSTGQSAQQTQKIVDAAAKANQAFGGSGEAFSHVSLALGQIASVGKVTMDNMNQISNSNAALAGALKNQVLQDLKASGKGVESFSQGCQEGKISVDDLNKAMVEVQAKGGKAIQTLPDAIDSLKESVGTKLQPAFDTLTKALVPLVNATSDWIDSWNVDKINKAIQSIDFKKVVDNIKNSVGPIVSSIGQIAKGFTSGLNISGWVSGFDRLKNAMLGVGKSGGGGLASLVGGTLARAFNGLGTVFSVIVDSALRLGDAFKGVFSQMSKGSSPLGTINTIIDKIVSSITKLVKKITDDLVSAIDAIDWSAVVKIFTNIHNAISDFIGFVADVFSSFLSSINFDVVLKPFKQLGDMFTTVAGNAKSSGLTQFLGGTLAKVVEDAAKILSTLISSLKQVGTAIGQAFSNNGGFSGGASALTKVLDGITKSIQDLIKLVGDSLAKAFAKIDFKTIGNGFDTIKDAVKGVAGFIGDVFSSFADTVDVNQVMAPFKALGDVFKQTGDTLKNSGFADAIGSTLGGLINSISNVFSVLFKNLDVAKITKPFIELGNAFKDATNSAKSSGLTTFIGQTLAKVINSSADVLGTLFDALKDVGKALGNAFSQSGGFKSGADTVSKVLEGITTYLKNVIKFYGQIGTELIKAIDFHALSSTFKSVMDVIGGLINFIKTVITSTLKEVNLTPLIKAFGSVADGAKDVMGAISSSGLATFLGSTLGAIINAPIQVIGELVKELKRIGGAFGDASKSTGSLKPFTKTVKDLIGGVVDIVKSFIKLVGSGISAAIKTINWKPFANGVNAIKDGVKLAIDWLKKLISSAKALPFRQIGTALGKGFGVGVNMITDFISDILNSFRQLLKKLRPVIDALKPLLKGLWDMVKGVAKALSATLGTAVETVGKGLKAISDIVKVLVKWIGKLIDGMQPDLSNVLKDLQPLLELLKIVFEAIATAVGLVFKGLGIMFGWLGDLFKLLSGPMGKVFKIFGEAIRDSILKPIDMLLKALKWVLDMGKKAFDWIADKLGSLFGKGVNVNSNSNLKNTNSSVNNASNTYDNHATINVQTQAGQDTMSIARQVIQLQRRGAI